MLRRVRFPKSMLDALCCDMGLLTRVNRDQLLL